MYIERETLLVKKVYGKKLSVSFKGLSDEEAAEKITQKELLFWKSQKSYQNFAENLYDSKILEKVVYKSLYIQNILFFNTKLSEKYKAELLDFPKRFIYESNKTEGSRISFEQLQIIFKSQKSSHKNIYEVQEVKNSIALWNFLQKGFFFHIPHIKKVYHILTHKLVLDSGDLYPRGFRRVDVVVNNSQTSKPENITQELERLLAWYKENKKEVFPLQLAFDFHLSFEKIHPFIDGNGRSGRMIMNKILLGTSFIPCIVFSENRTSYFNSIASTNSGRKKKYYTFMLEQYDKTLNTIL